MKRFNQTNMKRVLLILVLAHLCLVGVLAQKLVQGIPYQAVARDASGAILADLSLQVTVAFTDRADGAINYYAETHDIQTDENGFFELVIGDGISRNGYLNDVPWTKDEVWLEITINSSERADLALKSSMQLFSVPYAMYANAVNKLTEPEETTLRNHSIYWTSTGNVDTRPPFHFLGTIDNKELTVKTAGDTRATFTNDGQLQIVAGSTVRGSDTNPNAYPVTIKGANQGIFINIDGKRSTANNFVTFADNSSKEIHGTIEGQTYTELITSPFYIIQALLYSIEGANIVFSGIANGLKAAGFATSASIAAATLFVFGWAAPGLATAAVANGIKLGVDIASAAGLLLNSISWAKNKAEKVGVSYTSGSADYAEYLPRASFATKLDWGDIVGVKGGKVSKITQDADHLMVVSQNPSFLGNVPADGNTEKMEKIAFLGQVKVKVVGAVSAGDYILPSGNNDGVGIAVPPSEMRIEDYRRIVGVAWESAEEAPLNLVNCSIGMTQNEIAPKVEEISDKVDNIIGYLRGESPLRPEEPSAIPAAAYAALGMPGGQVEKKFTDEKFDAMVDYNAEVIRALYANAEQELQASGQVDLSSFPEMQALFDDPVGQLKKMRRDPRYEGLWGQLDQYLMQQLQSAVLGN